MSPLKDKENSYLIYQFQSDIFKMNLNDFTPNLLTTVL